MQLATYIIAAWFAASIMSLVALYNIDFSGE